MYDQSAQIVVSPPHGCKPRVQLSSRLPIDGMEMSFAANEEIFGEEEEADFVYRVIDGAVRTTRLLRDGRRQIVGFYMPGEVFGLECGDTHRFSAEAIVDSNIVLVKRAALTRAAEQDGAVAHELWQVTAHDLEALQDHMLLLGRKTAAERVASFLMRLSKQAKSQTIELPMSRGDIADHLGLTLETVSRMFSQFVRDGTIHLISARCVELKRLQHA